MDMVLMALLKKYVADSLVGVGALKGAPCTIKSITEITGGNRITFSWMDTDEVEHTSTLDVMNGQGDDSTFFGTQEEWEELTLQEKLEYTACCLTDDAINRAEDLEV